MIIDMARCLDLQNFRTNQLRTELYCTKRVMTSLSYEEPDFEEELINPIERSIGGTQKYIGLNISS